MSEDLKGQARRDYWQSQIEAWQLSGQSQQAFCRAHEMKSAGTGLSLDRALERQARIQRHRIPIAQGDPMTGVLTIATHQAEVLSALGVKNGHIAPIDTCRGAFSSRPAEKQ